MIIRSWIPLSLLALLSQVFSLQVHFQQQNVSKTLIEVLSEDEDYTSLLHLLQRAKLIPTLHRLNGSTFFAPTNEAIERHASRNSFWRTALSDDSLDLRDNIQEKLRQELFYHLLNYTIENLPNSQELQVHKTLHYPRSPIDPPSREPPPYPPWFPMPGGTLGGEPQRLRFTSRDSTNYVGADAFGHGGAEIVKDMENATNGVVFGIKDVVGVPPDLATVISRHPSLSYLSKILSPETLAFLNTTSALTLFLPVDSAWESLPHYERLYLESSFAIDDLTRILNMHAVVMKDVKYSDKFHKGLNLTTIHGPKLEITVSDNKTTVSTAELVEPDIYASNGVIHTVSSLLVPPGALELTPEKYLLVLNCTSFVSLIHSVNLTHLINDTDTHWTILAPRDDVIDIAGGSDLPERGSEELKRLLQYHFIPGKLPSKKLKDGMLLETALEEPGLAGGRQVLGVEVSSNTKGIDEKTIRFGGAGVIGDMVEINNTLIYFVSHTLAPPVDVMQTALPSLHLSTFLAAVFSTGLAHNLKTKPRTTLLIPHNTAFERLGMLVSSHLLAASSKSDLQQVISHHVLVEVEYAQNLQNASRQTFSTLEGSDVQLQRSRTENGTLLLTSSGGWADMHSVLFPNNTLTETGVIHEISDIMIPRSVDLNIGKLVRAAKATTMATMVIKAGFDWVLNGTAPPEGSRWAEEGWSGAGWTLLCPMDDAFKNINLTKLYQDTEWLQAIVSQHLIPVQPPPKERPSSFDIFDNVIHNRPLVLDDDTTYPTLRSSFESAVSGDVVFRKLVDGDDTVVGIKGARGPSGKEDRARVIAWGRSTTGGGTGGVIQIDSLLMPYSPSLWRQYGPPVGVGVVGVLLILLFFYGVRIVWMRDATEATFEPLGGFGQEDDDC